MGKVESVQTTCCHEAGCESKMREMIKFLDNLNTNVSISITQKGQHHCNA